MAQLVFLHGLESGPHGSKFKALAAMGLGPVLAPDCTGITEPAARMRVIAPALAEQRKMVIVGSSFGGLMALQYVAAHPEHVAALVLCAPAVQRAIPGWLPPPLKLTIPVRVLQGAQDALVPLAAVQAYCAANGLPVTVVEDDHALAASREVMADLVREVWRLI